MWSLQSTSRSQTTIGLLPDSHLFFRLRPALNAVKSFFQRIIDVPPIRRFRSMYVPYGEWKSLYMDNELSNMVSSIGSDRKDSIVLFDYEFVGIRRKAPNRNLMGVDTPVDSTDTLVSVYREYESKNVVDCQFSASDDFEWESSVIRGAKNVLSQSEVPTNLIFVEDVMSFPLLQETQVSSDPDSPSTGPSFMSEKDEGTEPTDDSNELEFGRDYYITDDARIVPLLPESEKQIHMNGITSAFQKDRSPGSTIETKSKEITANYEVRSGGKEPSHQPQVKTGVDSQIDDLKHVAANSTGFSRSESATKGPLGRKRNQRRRKSPLSKVSFRGMLHRAYKKLKKPMVTQTR